MKVDELNQRMRTLCVEDELNEVIAVLNGGNMNEDTIKLKRTINQKNYKSINGVLTFIGFIKYWRIIGPISHPNYESDLSLDGLRHWGIV